MSADDQHHASRDVRDEGRRPSVTERDRLMSLSMELHGEGRFEEARELLLPWISDSDPGIMASVAVLDALIGDYESARDRFLSALEHGEDPEILRGLAHICSQGLGRGDEAVDLLYRAWKASGELDDLLAAAMMAEGLDLGTAMALYQEAILVDGCNRLALYRGGQVMEAMGNPDGAELLYVRMLESNPEDITGLNAMCSLCGSRGDLASAQGFNDAVLSLEPDDLYANTVRQWLRGQGDERPGQE